MNYEIVPCWLVFETDVEGRNNGTLRFATIDVSEVNAEIANNAWSSIEDAKAIKIGDEYFVLKYAQSINLMGSKVKRELRKQALDKLSVEEIAVLMELGFK